MGLNRRQFLILGSAALGMGTSAVAQTFRHPNEKTVAKQLSAVDATANLPNLLAQGVARPAPTGVYAPMRGDVRLVVISDLNSRYGSTTYRSEVAEAMRMIPAWQPDLVICSGDMVAGQSLNLNRQQIQAMWGAFDQKVFRPIRQAGLPFALTLGNHDASSIRDFKGRFVYSRDREVANAFWNNPQRQLGIQFVDRAQFPFYYTFEQNQIFYLIWDASSAKVPAQQLAWAQRNLGSDRAQAAKLRIVLGHLPFYAVAQGRDRFGEILERAEDLRSLLERYRVHTYISGHHHVYFPGHVGQLELLHAGALGSGPRSWLDTTAAAIQTLTVVDIDLDTASTTYTTYNMGTFQVVNEQQLPRVIVGPNGRVLRRDMTWANLTPAERNRKYKRSQ